MTDAKDNHADFTYSGWCRKVHLEGIDSQTGQPFELTAFMDAWRQANGRFAGELAIAGSFGTHYLRQVDLPERFEEGLFGDSQALLRQLYGEAYNNFDARAAYEALCEGLLRRRRDRDWEEDETGYLWGDLVQMRDKLLASDPASFVQLVESLAEDCPYRLVKDYCASAGGFLRWAPVQPEALQRCAWEPLLAALASSAGEPHSPGARPDTPRG